jgi:heme/copper-type cytochrome/quinol oxidase subunit 2
MRIYGVLIGLAPVLLHRMAHACAVCLNGAGGERLTDAFNWSVLFLMAMPYTILFSVIGFFFYSYRRAAKKARGETEKGTPLHLAWIHKESGR